MKDASAERAVLAGMFRHGQEAYLDVCDLITPRTFTDQTNQVLFKCFEKIFKDSSQAVVDYPSIESAASGLGLQHKLQKKEDLQMLRAVMQMPVEQPTVRKMAAKIRKLEIARDLEDRHEQAKLSLGGITGDESIDQIVAMSENPIFDFTMQLASTNNQGIVRMGDGAEAYLEYIMDNPREIAGISTGFSAYDYAIGGGVRPGSVDMIVARPKTGKTQVVDNVGVHVADKVGVPCLNVDTEMTKEEHQIRVAANMAGVPCVDIETGKVAVRLADRAKVLEAARKLRDMPYYYNCIIGQPFEETMAQIRRWVMKDVGLDASGNAKPCMVIFDYLKMMSAEGIGKQMQEYQSLGFMMTSLKNFMGRMRVSCLCFGQCNREGIDKDDTDIVAGSDRIVWFCTSLSIYRWKHAEERAEEGQELYKYTHKLIPIISRFGAGLAAGDYINMQARYDIGRIIEGPTKSAGSGVDKKTKGMTINDGCEDQLPFGGND